MPLAFGVPALDDRLGAVAPGGTLLLEGTPDVEGLPWLLQAAATHLAAGRPVVFVAVVRAPQRVRAAMAGLGFSSEGPGGLWFVDAYSGLVGDIDPHAAHVADPCDMGRVLEALSKAAADHPGAVLLVEALDTLVDRFGASAFRAGADAWRKVLGQYLFAAASATSWSEGGGTGAAQAFDAVVRMRSVEDRLVLNQVFEVSRTPWNRATGPCLYKVSRPGGIHAHIPKIVVVGPHDAGKSSFVRSACEGSISVERMGTTVALDRGTMTHDGIRAELFGTPGQARFDALLPVLAAQASAAVLVVDGTDPASFPRAGEMLERVWKHGLTAVVAVNKQDLPGALDPPAAAALLELPGEVPVVPCQATHRPSVRAIVATLARRVLEGT